MGSSSGEGSLGHNVEVLGGEVQVGTLHFVIMVFECVCCKLQKQITAEYNRGPERCRGLASRWWKEPLDKILATNVVDQEKWLNSVQLPRRRGNRQGKAAKKQRHLFRTWITIAL